MRCGLRRSLDGHPKIRASESESRSPAPAGGEPRACGSASSPETDLGLETVACRRRFVWA